MIFYSVLREEVRFLMCENTDSGKDKLSELDSIRLSVPIFSAVLVLAGVIAVSFGNPPIVPCNISENMSVEKSELIIPLCLPVVGDIPMISFLPNYNTSDFDVFESEIPENSLPVISLTMSLIRQWVRRTART